ncbi:MAG: DEAD/DEAH box helicase [Clostridia bacterium]|nr:DEAD/DEAH box helicase [Clostridia bacterium]
MEEVTFESLDCMPQIKRALADMGFVRPTPVQAQTIPPMLQWYDVIAKAPTGTGKTCAFGVPILEHIEPDIKDVQALILCPTRELALQITTEMRSFAKHLPYIKVATIYGGQNIQRQFEALRLHPQIVVATPGRLMDHMDRGSIHIDQVHTAILDEADRMLDMGFVHDVRKILDCMPNLAQLSLFSATMSREVLDIAWIYQREDAVEVTIPEDEENRPQIRQFSLDASGKARMDAISRIIRDEKYDRVLVFCNTKHMVSTVSRRLAAMGLNADCIHGDVAQRTRERVISDFRKGKVKVLVATDVAARGLDIEDVDAVFNYDIPNENEYYTHRIGRTGRAKKTGASYTFVSPLTAPRLAEIMKYTKTPIIPYTAETRKTSTDPV